MVSDYDDALPGPLRPVPRDALPGREVPPLVLDGAPEVRDLPAHAHVRPDLVRLALEEEVGPQGRPDEPGAVDPDHARIEQVDPGLHTLRGELRPRLVDLGPVELVVAEHVEDVRGARPLLCEVLDQALGAGREVAREHDDVGFEWCSGTCPPCSRWRSERTWIFMVRSVLPWRLVARLEVGREPTDRRPRRHEIDEPPCRRDPENTVCNNIELPPRDGEHEDHRSEHGCERADAKDDSPELKLLEDPGLHGERAPDEPERPGHDERARAASKEGPGIAQAQREGEGPREGCSRTVRQERAL